ncbi:hypothetical protein [Streptomyces kanamyceticus]|uniref:Putative integral membrane protein n=1 Tax=Streptomyces kanamyceticus TaxID=1967 RepID=Q1EQQ0_STRKN|nr:hypothetical protein [Streptomyces kanamyceticus]BAE95470.1 putative integral membrane protein [Streptomyces kanamyceticus]
MRLRLREDAPGLLAVERSGPGRGWGRRLQTVAWVNVVIAFVFVPSAVANPFCYIPMVCEAKAAIDFISDPLGFLLQKLTEANIWFLRKMLELIQNTTKVDLTSPGFLKQYAIIFAASSLITAALWLVAVAKRAVRGVALTTAVSEAIGFLVLQFFVNALTPGAIALLMKAIDEVTAVFEPYAVNNFKPFLENILKIMAASPSDGVGQLIVVNLIMMAGALLMWVEMLIRGAAIYVAVALGPVVNAGLVDRDLWGKSKKWFGALFAIGLSKPVLFALLGLGGAILSDSTGSMSDAVSKTLVGALILLLAVFASATLYKWVPAFGDEMAQLHHDRKAAQSSGPASVVDGPAQHANRALNTHIQDSLVGGGKPASKASAPAAGGKGAPSPKVGGQAGTASAKAASGSGVAASAAGPLGAAGAAVKAGGDAAKNRAMGSPGAQGADASSDSGEQSPGASASGTPVAARSRAAGPGSVIGSDTQPPGAGSTPASSGAPAAAPGQGAPSGPVVAPKGTASAPPPATARPASSPYSPPGPPSGAGTPVKPPTSKDQ